MIILNIDTVDDITLTNDIIIIIIIIIDTLAH